MSIRRGTVGVVWTFLAACAGGSSADESHSMADESGAADHAAASGAATIDPTPTMSATRVPGQEVPLSGTETDRDWEILLDRIRWARSQGLEHVDIGEAVAAIGQTFVGDPYTPRTLEVAGASGPEALVVNLREFDCVTFVESSLAIARTVQRNRGVDDEDALRHAFIEELAGLRYRAGVIDGYPSRLHYFSEWIDDNARRGTVQPMAHLLGGTEDTEPVNFMSTHADAYVQLADPDNLEAIRDVEARLADRPRYPVRQNRIEQFEKEIRTGDVIAATSTVEGLDVAHTGLALWLDGRLHLMHAPLVGKSVEISELPLAERIQGIAGQDGIFVARPAPVGSP